MHRDVRLLMIAVIFCRHDRFLSEMAFRALVYGPRVRMYNSNDRKNGAGMLLLLALAVLAVGYVFSILIRFTVAPARIHGRCRCG